MFYYIQTINGVITYISIYAECGAVKNYFTAQCLPIPERIAVKSCPFSGMYLTQGTEENGNFVAFKIK
jgi:hypothetical protein